ncbi:MAG: lytic murein transglycosylase, partial [Cellvibrio sp.]|uniref:lytic murein transglycosylase n=1 Tax=Cellvibrio sp. TaxID=1965322 RepID=UPI002725B04C|nr:lytic murein transglycosylase [Cellvibrio sp.]
MQGYGWIKGGPVAVRAEVGEVACAGVASTPRSLTDWASVGVTANIRRDEPSRLLDYTVADGKEYWLGFNNFDVITRYNNSDYYAMSVFQLSEALKAAHQSKH